MKGKEKPGFGVNQPKKKPDSGTKSASSSGKKKPGLGINPPKKGGSKGMGY